MQIAVDLDSAVETARRAAEFEWTWTAADVEPFSRANGWTAIEDSNGTGPRFRTGLGERAFASATITETPWEPHFAPGDLVGLGVPLALAQTPGDHRSIVPVTRAFADLGEQFLAALGTPDSARFEYSDGFVWKLPRVHLGLSLGTDQVRLSIHNPKFTEWLLAEASRRDSSEYWDEDDESDD